MLVASGLSLFRSTETWTRRTAVVVAASVLLSTPLLTLGLGAPAVAAYDADGSDFWTDSAMGPIKSRVFRAADGNTDRVVYALDGMRAREDLSGWEIETDIAQQLTDQNINVVMPIGGRSSFYADWDLPSTFLGVPAGMAAGNPDIGETQVFAAGPGKSYAYQWETFLTRDLPKALSDRLGFNPSGNGVLGLSMGGSAALTLAAYHPDQFSFAASFSGYLNPSAPGMRDAIRLAMLDAGGYNLDCMIASPLSNKWQRMDPTFFAPILIRNGTKVWVSAADGVPTAADGAGVNTAEGSVLESLALANTRMFQIRMTTLGAQNATYDFPASGIHSWKYWQDEVARMLPELSTAIG